MATGPSQAMLLNLDTTALALSTITHLDSGEPTTRYTVHFLSVLAHTGTGRTNIQLLMDTLVTATQAMHFNS